MSNGWVWGPWEVLLCFSTKRFLTGWETTGSRIQGVGYNGDRPITWIDPDTLVVAEGKGEDPDDYHEPSHPFGIHRLPLPDSARWRDRSGFIPLDVLPLDQYGEIQGYLDYSPNRGCLIAISPSDCAMAVAVDGEITAAVPEIRVKEGWRLAPTRGVCYRWDPGATTLECRSLG